MSRTNRSSGRWYYNKREFDGVNKHWDILDPEFRIARGTWEEHLREIRQENSWNMSTPSWWIHDTSTIRERQQTRNLLQQVYKLIDYEDSPEFPLDKKPYEYYW